MKILVIYYSLGGNTKFIAETISKTINAESLELKPVKDISNTGIMKYFWGGRQVMMKEKPELKPFDINPDNYDLIFIGTPVWAFNYTPTIATFFESTKLKDKKIALFCCSGGSRGKTFENMKKQLDGNEIIGEIEFVEPLKRSKDESEKKVIEWAKEIIK